MRRILALATLFSAVIAGAQAPEKISFSCRAQALSSALQELGRKLDLQITAAPAIRHLPVVIHATDVSRETLLAKLAEAAEAEWQVNGTQRTLGRSGAKQRELEQRELNARAADLARGIQSYLQSDTAKWDRESVLKMIEEERRRRDELLKQISGQGGGGGRVSIRTMGTTPVAPAGLAVRDAIRNIPPAMLAAIRPGERVVFSSNPTRVQRGIPFNYAPTLNAFVQAHNLLASLVKSTGEINPDIQISGGLDLDAKPLSGPLGKLLIIVQRLNANDPGISLQVKIADAKGVIVGDAQAWVGSGLPAEEDPPAAPAAGTDAIEISPLHQEFARLLAGDPTRGNIRRGSMALNIDGDFVTFGGEPPRIPPMSNEVRAIFMNPAANEPLATFPTEILMGWADAKGLDLVAVLPDELVNDLQPLAAGGRVTAGQVRNALDEGGMTVSESEGFAVLRSAAPVAAERTRTNRTALSRFIQSSSTEGFAKLDEAAAYAVAMPYDYSDRNLDMRLMNVIIPTSIDGFTQGSQGRHFLRMYGLMTPGQRLANQAEVVLAVNQMTPAQRQLTDQIVYGAGGTGIIGRGSMSMIAVEDGPGGDEPPAETLANEPTEAMPTGTPLDGLLKIARRSIEGLYGLITGQDVGKLMTAQELGLTQGLATMNPGGGTTPTIPTYDRFRLATILRMAVQLDLKVRTYGATLTDASVTGNRPMTYEQLPDSIRKVIEDTKARMRGNTIGFRGSQRPPQS